MCEGHQKLWPKFVKRHFYEDDCRISYPTEGEALDILQKMQTTLKEGGNLIFQKFASKNAFVMDHLPIEDRAKNLIDVNLDLNPAPFQRTPGLPVKLSAVPVSHTDN